MKSITREKPFDQIKEQIADFDQVFIIGCGTCTTMTKTGGIDQVLEMRDRLQELDKRVSGWTVIPIACDEMTEVAMKENGPALQGASCILAMTCALGVPRVVFTRFVPSVVSVSSVKPLESAQLLPATRVC